MTPDLTDDRRAVPLWVSAGILIILSGLSAATCLDRQHPPAPAVPTVVEPAADTAPPCAAADGVCHG